jgi:hypothetical protein
VLLLLFLLLATSRDDCRRQGFILLLEDRLLLHFLQLVVGILRNVIGIATVLRLFERVDIR